MSHCTCPDGTDETYYEDVSPDHHDGESWAEKCVDCAGLIRMH